MRQKWIFGLFCWCCFSQPAIITVLAHIWIKWWNLCAQKRTNEENSVLSFHFEIIAWLSSEHFFKGRPVFGIFKSKHFWNSAQGLPQKETMEKSQKKKINNKENKKKSSTSGEIMHNMEKYIRSTTRSKTLFWEKYYNNTQHNIT